MERVGRTPLWFRELERADAVEVGLDLEEVADIDPVKLHVQMGQYTVYDTLSCAVISWTWTHQNEGGVFSVEGVALVDLGHGGVHSVGGRRIELIGDIDTE